MTSPFPLAPLERLVVWTGYGKRGKPCAGKDHRPRWSLRHPGPASCLGPRVLLLLSGSARRAGGLVACLRMLQVAFVSLDLIDSHLDEQDVAEDAVWSLLRHQFRRGSFPLSGGWTTVYPTFPAPFRDPQHVCGIPKSSARKHGLQPSEVERTRIANLLAQQTAEACSTVGHGRGDFLFCSRDPAWVPRPCLTWRHMSSWHVPEPGAPTSGNRQLVPIARPSVWSCIGRWTSRQWKRSLTIPLACSKPRSRVTGGQQPPRGHCSSGKDSLAVILPLPVTPAPLTHRPAATVASHLPTTSCPSSRPALARHSAADLAGWPCTGFSEGQGTEKR